MDAHSLLEGMPPGENDKKMAVLPPAGGGGGDVGIDAMPEGVLEHIVGFLPAPDAVRTCVLARRWRHLWKSATGLRVDCRDDEGRPAPVKEHREFVDQLFLVRRGLPLDTCELTLGEFEDNDVPRMNRRIQHAIMCKARVLRIRMLWDWYLELRDLPLVSRHLTRLELLCVRTRTSFLDFSSCPALEHLELVDCGLSDPMKLSSESLKHLSIAGCYFHLFSRTCICAPNLVSLRLVDPAQTIPLFESMPSLVDAFIRLTAEEMGSCCAKLSDPSILDCICELCDGNSCVLLKGLSEAKSLVLISGPEEIIFKSDLRWCPVFSNLKTLLLNDYWCVPDKFNALACILEHSPVLEKLTLLLFSEGPKHKVEMKGSFSLMERSAAISEHLKIVDVKCEVVDERVLKVLKFLCTFNIRKLTCNSPDASNISNIGCKFARK